MNRLQKQLLSIAEKGYQAFLDGKPCVPPYKFTPNAKGLYRLRVEHWTDAWKEAESNSRQRSRTIVPTTPPNTSSLV